MITTLSLQPSHYFILLVLAIIIISIILFIKWLFKKETSKNKKIFWLTLICMFFSLWALSFYNKNYSVQAQIEKKQNEKTESKSSVKEDRENVPNLATQYYNNEDDYYEYNYKNKVQLPIPKLFELVESDNQSATFKISNQKLNDFINIKESGIVITNEPKKSNLSQDNILDTSLDNLDKMRDANELMMNHLIPTLQGWENMKLEDIGITAGTNNKNCNYILTNFDFNNKGKKFFSKLYLIPKDKEIIRVQYYFYYDNEHEMEVSGDNISLIKND